MFPAGGSKEHRSNKNVGVNFPTDGDVLRGAFFFFSNVHKGARQLAVALSQLVPPVLWTSGL